ncbi:MAG: dephospho-CoA kinase [Leptolyngbya sp.]|nr:dephospho-CoA kinase [Candidatus Melainabacteria bacterium]
MSTSQTVTTGGSSAIDCTGPYRIGITSSIGAGKSTLGKMLAELGVPVIDTDHVTHELLNSPNPAYDKVLACFGDDLVAAPGAPIDRQKLAAIVFAPGRPDARKQLEAILHPAIRQVTRERLRAFKVPVVAALVPLLFESGLKDEYHETWCLIIDPDKQVARLITDTTRTGMDEAQARTRIAAQMPQDKKAELADRVIDNSGTLEDLRKQVEDCLKLARQAGRARHRKCSGEEIPTPPSTPVPPVVVAEPPAPTEGEPREPVDETVPVPPPGDTPVEASGEGDAPSGETPETGETAPLDETPIDTETPAEGDKAGCESALTDEARDNEYRRILETFGQIGTQEALSQLGKIGTTAHKEAAASLSMTVATGGKADDGSDCDPREHELKVDVKMTVRQKTGAPAPDEHGCKCHCGKTCRVTCACAPDCGCVCKPPVPPTPPTPPTPEKKSNKAWWALAAFILVVLAVWCLWPRDHGGSSAGGGSGTGNNPPVVVTQPPVGVPVDPSATNCPVVTTSRTQTAPDFVAINLQNQVKWRVYTWVIEYRGDACGATASGRTAGGELVNRMEFGPSLQFKNQLVVTYESNGRRIVVDRFEPNGFFSGRTIYEANASLTKVETVRQLDAHQRPTLIAHFSYAGDGSLVQVELLTLSLNNASVAERNLLGPGANTYDLLKRYFFLYGEVAG